MADQRLVISRAKIAAKDPREVLVLLYLLNPQGFTALAKRQKFIVEDLADVEALVNEPDFKPNTLARQLPLTAKQIADGRNRISFN